jgi:UDP-N-acetylmuramate--alanine ligase
MFEFFIKDHKYSHVHFIGIGGISMSGLAEILLIEGYKVSGTDAKESGIIDRLRKLGAKIYIGHSKENIQGADLIIYTDAISKDNEELVAAANSEAELVDRATFLGALMKNYENSIAVSGTHGKTTTTSMIATITNHVNLNPTILIGGELDEIGGNVRLGNNKYFLTEACEYKANILKYYPTLAIILNIDEDHLDYFKSLDHIIDTFVQYGKNIPENGNLIINKDDPNAHYVINSTRANVVTFGINENCDYRAENITYTDEGYPKYTLNIRNTEFYDICLSVMGKHNIYNSLAAIAATHTLGINMEEISKNLTLYKGVHRRLELLGYMENVKIIDDYAHHPTEIKASLKALRSSAKGKIYCIFQPHTFTRTKALLNSFAEAFSDADITIIADIYAARELDNGEIHSRDLANRIIENGNNALYLGSFEDIKNYIIKEVKDDDIILTMGAGNVYQIGKDLLNSYKKKAV